MATYLARTRLGSCSQNMHLVIRQKIEGDKAEVLCHRVVKEQHRQQKFLELYFLRKEQGQWRITAVTSNPAR